MFERFFGNTAATTTLRQMIESERIPQTILLEGPEGIGKATLARRFATELLGDGAKIEADDLSLASNTALIADREKWPAEKRNEDPLLFASHPDFVTFAPDGPLRQLSVPQMRVLREQAQLRPLKGNRRVFLIDQIDRANEQAANSLLKTLEEPPEHLILILTTSNAYELLPTIRSRVVPVRLSPLSVAEMKAFLITRGGVDFEARRLALAGGSPGAAVTIDLETYDKRRNAMLVLLKAASGNALFGEWARTSDSLGASRTEKLDDYLVVLSRLLEDLLLLLHKVPGIRNADIEPELKAIAARIEFPWIAEAVRRVDELGELVRRNIQKSLALDALVLELRALSRVT